MASGTETRPPPTPSRKTPYERLKFELDHDQRVAQELTLGKRIGFYRLKGQLGTGNFSRVKLGVHLLTTEKVAIKIIDKASLDENARRLLSREITCMERLDHPNVIRLFEVIEGFPRLHIIMECASGGDLHGKIVKNGPFGDKEGKHIFIQVMAAINHMHKKGVIHRDLKAENVFFVSSTQIKVGDFGFSTHNTGSPLDTFCGSPPYAAPELFCEENYSGPLVDVWAMGVLLYFMLSGNMPFRGDTIPQLKEKILEGKYHMPKHLPPSCQDLISGILTKDVSERYTIHDLISNAWLKGDQNDIPCLSSDSGVGGSESMLANSFNTGDTLDSDVLQSLRELGVPTSDMEQLLGEPRSPIAGTYRILLHRKHMGSLNSVDHPAVSKENGHVPTVQREMTATAEQASGSGKAKTGLKSKICVIL